MSDPTLATKLTTVFRQISKGIDTSAVSHRDADGIACNACDVHADSGAPHADWAAGGADGDAQPNVPVGIDAQLDRPEPLPAGDAGDICR